MILLDTNVVIYAADPGYPSVKRFLARNDTAVSAVSYVEALGFHRLHPNDRISLEQFFAQARQLPLDRPVLERAVDLRQQRRMSLGDSLVAATALVHGMPLATNNQRDFTWIPGLRLMNPVTTN